MSSEIVGQARIEELVRLLVGSQTRPAAAIEEYLALSRKEGSSLASHVICWTSVCAASVDPYLAFFLPLIR